MSVPSQDDTNALAVATEDFKKAKRMIAALTSSDRLNGDDIGDEIAQQSITFGIMKNDMRRKKDVLDEAEKVFNKKQIALAIDKMQAIYASEDDVNIIDAVMMARCHAKARTQCEADHLKQLQLEYDAAENAHEEFHGSYVFPHELAAFHAKSRMMEEEQKLFNNKKTKRETLN